MKLLISFLMIFQMICTNVEFYGKSYIVYDSLNQYVVEGRNIDYLQSVASISKIMTAIVVIENSRLRLQLMKRLIKLMGVVSIYI